MSRTIPVASSLPRRAVRLTASPARAAEETVVDLTVVSHPRRALRAVGDPAVATLELVEADLPALSAVARRAALGSYAAPNRLAVVAATEYFHEVGLRPRAS